MAGTTEGGSKAAKKNKKLYGKDFYRIIGAKGGKKTSGYEFAHGKLDPSATGKLGGRPPS